MSNSFVRTFEEVRGDISLPKLAQEIAQRTNKNPGGVSGNLYRLLNGRQTPKRGTIIEIAEALASLKNLSAKAKKQLQERLTTAAHPPNFRAIEEIEVSEAENRRRLRPSCERALRKINGLTEIHINSILDHAGAATMKLIIAADKKGEEIEIIPLQRISEEYQRASRPTRKTEEAAAEADIVIDAGRARILIDGKASESQLRVLQSAAEMIESVLKL